MSDNNHYYAVIMAGGLGTRFWPISRKALPKQFLDLGNTGTTFLEQAYARVARVVPKNNIIVVTLKEYKHIVRSQLPDMEDCNILEELYNRNTAPCITYATQEILKRDPEAVCVVCPADHIVKNETAFDEVLVKALGYASESNSLITIGVMPTRPDPNFGYIQVTGGAKSIRAGEPVKVKTFTEKPDRSLAEVFIKSGEFLWNSGIFVWKASVIKEEIERYAPQIAALWKESDDIDRIYTDCARISIDYAVMEKTDRAVVIPASFGWADIGNWETLYENMSTPDEGGNVTDIEGKHLFKDNENSIVFSTSNGKLMAVKGLKDMIVVDTADVLMICPRDDSSIKQFLSELALPQFEEFR